jgi:5-methylcytosine-specific restriction protein A
MDPVTVYGGQHGPACIEVHHHSVQVEDMAETHRTKLEDLQCLCANCYRVVHRWSIPQLSQRGLIDS